MREKIAAMSLREKALLLTGKGNFDTNAVERLGIPSMKFADGPIGLRMEREQDPCNPDPYDSEPSVCMPCTASLACSFDTDLAERYGAALGSECARLGGHVLLGPGVNIKRHPYCGRNFEYYSEDPTLTTEMAAGMIRGIQSRGVAACIKHFCCNNRETDRLTSDSVVDERTLYEIYLAAFEGAIRQAKPACVMAAYNRLNGTYCCENKTLLTDILREQWGFDGLVMSDWGAVDDIVESVRAGMDLEMPSSYGMRAELLESAVREGRLKEEDLNRAAEAVLKLIERTAHRTEEVISPRALHTLAGEIAAQCMVLLKNDGILPFSPGVRLALAGPFAKEPRFQGAGSARINPFAVDSLAEELEKEGASLWFADRWEDCAARRGDYDAVLFCGGLSAREESEGFDRTSFSLPEEQLAFLRELVARQIPVVFLLLTGSPPDVTPLQSCRALVLAGLSGEAFGSAAAAVLFGRVNPSGRLAETYPRQICDVASDLCFSTQSYTYS